MTTDQLDLSAFKKAIDRLKEGWERYQQDISDTQIRDGLIQRFKFIYEISHKTLKRYLEFSSANPAAFDEMSFQDLIRSGSEQNLLLGAWPDWKRYRDMRSRTGHTYDENVALEVVAGIPTFLTEACYLCDQIQARQV